MSRAEKENPIKGKPRKDSAKNSKSTGRKRKVKSNETRQGGRVVKCRPGDGCGEEKKGKSECKKAGKVRMEMKGAEKG